MKSLSISLRITLATILCALTFSFQACSSAQIQNILTAVSGWAHTAESSWTVYQTSLHSSGQKTDESFKNFLVIKTKVDSGLVLFDSSINAIKDKQGAINLINALIPVANEFIASGLVIKNPQEQAKAIAIATAASLTFQTITAVFGNFHISVPAPSAELKEVEQSYEKIYIVEFTQYLDAHKGF